MKDMEIEVKFHLTDMNTVREKILTLGGEGRGRFFESNLRFEDSDLSLCRKGCLLRLRKDRAARLTFKAPADSPDPEVKTRRELEVTVSDFDTMKSILESLGFSAVQVYEKWRETFILEEVCLCLDKMPFGDFIEIEGDGRAIRQMAARLGLDWKKRILSNYLGMFEKIRRILDLPFSNLTFADFETLSSEKRQKALKIMAEFRSGK